jgi:hypothetical protein
MRKKMGKRKKHTKSARKKLTKNQRRNHAKLIKSRKKLKKI